MITAIDKNTALVLIDLQKGIVGMNAAHGSARVVEQALTLMAAFRKAGLPVVIVNVKPSGAALLSRKDNNAMRNLLPSLPADFSDIVPEIKTEDGDILITKQTWNAFYETSLHEALKKRNITGIVICGISASAGVEGTARAAAERGYNISFATDAMTDANSEAQQNSIKHVFPRLGEVGSSEDIIEKLGSRV